MEISIKTVKGKNINLEVDDTSDTIDLKIHGPTRRLSIRLGRDQDSDSDPDPEAVMRILLSTITGRLTILYVEENETIANLKEKYHAKDGIPVDQQRILFQGQQLEDGRTLADYGIKTDSTLVIMYRLCGC